MFVRKFRSIRLFWTGRRRARTCVQWHDSGARC